MLWETDFRWSSCSERNYHNPCLKITDKFTVANSLQLATKTRHEMGQYFIVLKISPFSFYCFQDDEKEKKMWQTWKKVYWEDKKEKPARKEYEEKAKINSNAMQNDVFWHLFNFIHG